MQQKEVTLLEVRETINHLVQGVDPYTGEVLGNVSFLQNPRMIRCFAMMSDLSTQVLEKGEKKTRSKQEPFQLDQVAASKIVLPVGDVGISAIASAINEQVDLTSMKQLTPFNLNRKLIDMGLLSLVEEDGKKATVLNERSKDIGLTTVKATFKGLEYDKIIYNQQAKQFVLDHLLKWFG